MGYYNFFGGLSIFIAIILPIISVLIFYYIIKAAVRNGVIEANKRLDK